MRTIHHTVNDPNGIHARPAGILVNTAKQFDSEINLVFGDKVASLKRIFSVMGMALKEGDKFIIEISGTDEDASAEALENAIRDSGI